MDSYLPLIMRGTVTKVPVREIIYIMKVNRKVRIVTEGAQYEYYERIENMMQYLDGRFYACLKGTIINLDKVEKMEAQTIRLQNGEVLVLGRDNFIRAKQRYAAWLKKLIN